jgi:hypothetical protein
MLENSLPKEVSLNKLCDTNTLHAHTETKVHLSKKVHHNMRLVWPGNTPCWPLTVKPSTAAVSALTNSGVC